MLRLFFTLAGFIGLLLVGTAQTKKIDSLRGVLLHTKTESARMAALFALCEERMSLPTDSLFEYAQQASALAAKNGMQKDRLLGDYYVASVLAKRGKADSALALLNTHSATVQSLRAEGDLQNKYSFLKGQLLMVLNRQKEALEIYYAALERGEKTGDTMAQVVAKNSIGWAYMELNQNREAVDWFTKAIRTTANARLFEKYPLVFSNLAATYNTLGQNDSAEYFINEALRYSRRGQNLQSTANSLAIQADIFIDTRRNAKAEAALAEAVQIRKQVGDPFYIVSDLTQLAIFYAHNGQPQKAVALCREGIDTARHYKLSSKLSILYDALATAYKAAGDNLRYAETLQQLMAVKDSAYQQASADALAELQARYDVQKKENIILQQRFDLQRKNAWLYGGAAFSALVLLSLFLLFKAYRRRQQLKMQLMQEEEGRKAERAVVSAEEAERKRIAADLHDSLGAYAASIASNIQQLEGSLGGNGVLHELKANAQAIVSQLSDTIWVLKKDALLLTSISDRIKLFIQKISPSHPQVTIDVVEEIETDHLLPPAQAFHLFQIIKEAVINALRHSGCTQTTVRLEAAAAWRISVADNGRGFYKEALLAEGGNGMQNMQSRAKESGWKIEWREGEPQGTKVEIMSNE